METYYKYAERQADSFVNWAEIGKNLTDMLQREFQIREQKKAAIDQATRESLKELSNQPTGQHEGLNAWSLKYADEAREAILLQDRLLKKGILKLKDYTIMRQNLNDGTDELYSAIKGYQEIFKTKMDRLRSNDPANKSQQIEVDLMSMIEGFSDFSKSKVLIDPTNFTVSVGIMEPDPDNQGVMKVSKNVATTSFLKKIQDTKFDYFDSSAAATEIAKKLGTFVRTTIQEGTGLEGKVISLEDMTKSPKYQSVIKDMIGSYLSNPYNVTSILTEDIIDDEANNPYVSNISGLKGNVIEYVFDGQSNLPTPKITKEQYDAAYKYMQGMIEVQLKYEYKETPYNKPRPSSGDGEETPSSGNTIEKIYSDYLSAVEGIGLNESSFDTNLNKTVNNLQSILSQVPGGLDLSVEPGGLFSINLKKGDTVIKTFNTLALTPDKQRQYVNEFKGILSNLAEPAELAIWTKRSGAGGGIMSDY
jgi:hypothetical protein